MAVPESAIRAAALALEGRSMSDASDRMVAAAAVLHAALPDLLKYIADQVRSDCDHIVPGGDGYSSGFHYALHCVSRDEEGV